MVTATVTGMDVVCAHWTRLCYMKHSFLISLSHCCYSVPENLFYLNCG